jgi:hypothetical protein
MCSASSTEHGIIPIDFAMHERVRRLLGRGSRPLQPAVAGRTWPTRRWRHVGRHVGARRGQVLTINFLRKPPALRVTIDKALPLPALLAWRGPDARMPSACPSSYHTSAVRKKGRLSGSERLPGGQLSVVASQYSLRLPQDVGSLAFAPKGNAVKDSWGRFSLHVAVGSANERIFAERKATYMRTVQRQNT